MDELEQRLTNVLTKVSERADPAVARLRNPAASPRRKTTRFSSGRPHPAWVVVASSVAVAGVAVGIALGIPKIGQRPEPASSAPASATGPSRGKSDGTHALWPLGVMEGYPETFDRLPAGGRVDLPVPHTVDQSLVPELVNAPTLVTAAGTIRFAASDTKAVHLLAQRRQGLFIALTGTGHDGEDGLHDVRFEIAAPDNTRREFYRAAEASSVTVSPDGTTLAVSTWLGGGGQQSQPAVELVDVASGRVAHRLPGRFTQAAWASDSAVLLSGKPGEATSIAWRAPWTGAGERIPVRGGTAMTVAGGLVALDDSKGCLQRLAADATVTAVNCDKWRSAGHVSPDGRYVSLEWSSGDGRVQYGVLDLRQNQVRSWPVPGMNPSWLGPADVLLTRADTEDIRMTARCDLSTNTYVRAPEAVHEGVWRGAAWIGS
jgi:hypothetical protein